MRGDEERAAALAEYLESGVLDDRIAILENAVYELRDVLAALAPAAAYVEAVGAQLAIDVPPPSAALKAIRIGVADLDRAATFYRDGLGLDVQAESDGQITLDGGGGFRLVLERRDVGDPNAVPLEFSVDDLYACIAHLRDLNVEVRMARERGLFRAELLDPDGRPIVLR